MLLKKSSYLISIVLCALLVGCAGGPNGKLPTVTDKAQAAQIHVVRNKNIIGSGGTFTVLFDDKPIYDIGVGEYLHFYAPTGKHTIGVSCWGGWIPKTWKESIPIDLKAQQQYYFSIFHNGNCAGIKALSKSDAMKHIKESTDITKK